MAKAKQAAPESTALTVMPKFVAKEAKSYEVEANYDEVEVYLKGTLAKYKDVAFSPENMDEVTKVKGEMVGLRTSLASILEAEKKKRFNAPKAIFQAKMDSLIAIVSKVESEVQKVLDAKDQERIDELNEILDSYKEQYQTIYSLEDQFLARVEYKKNYYNVTQKEKDSRDDLKMQFETLKKEQTARNGSIKLIQKALADTPVINEQAQIDKLDAGDDVASILEWIEEEKDRLVQLEKPASPSVSIGVADGPAAQAIRSISGVASKIDLSTDFPGKTKTAYVAITYPFDGGAELTKLFKELKESGVIVRHLQPEELNLK